MLLNIFIEKWTLCNLGEHKMAKVIKFKKLLNESGIFDEDQKVSTETKRAFLEFVGKYNEYGKIIYHEGNLVELGKRFSKIVELAEHITVTEAGDWFDGITVSRNMKELKGFVKEFNKVAGEEQSMRNRLSTLYEDIGHILNRYYEIKELNEDDLEK